MLRNQKDSLPELNVRRESLVKVIALQNQVIHEMEVALKRVDGNLGSLLLIFKDEAMNTVIELPPIDMEMVFENWTAGLWLMLDKLHDDAVQKRRSAIHELYEVENLLFLVQQSETQ